MTITVKVGQKSARSADALPGAVDAAAGRRRRWRRGGRTISARARPCAESASGLALFTRPMSDFGGRHRLPERRRGLPAVSVRGRSETSRFTAPAVRPASRAGAGDTRDVTRRLDARPDTYRSVSVSPPRPAAPLHNSPRTIVYRALVRPGGRGLPSLICTHVTASS